MPKSPLSSNENRDFFDTLKVSDPKRIGDFLGSMSIVGVEQKEET